MVKGEHGGQGGTIGGIGAEIEGINTEIVVVGGQGGLTAVTAVERG